MSTRVGIIGTGSIANAHIDAINKLPDVEVSAISGRNTVRARELAKAAGGQVYEDYHHMLYKENLDAVFILMPPHIHGEVEKACAEHVPAVLIEKPICSDLQIALEIENKFKEAKTIVSVGYMNRYRSSIQRARQIFSSQEQKPVLINGWWVSDLPGPLWWRNMSQSGGQFVEQCTHLVDAARYIAGDIVEVSAYNSIGFIDDVSDYTVDDAMVVNVRFASGAIGNFTNGCYLLPGFRSHEGMGLNISSRETHCSFTGWGMKLNIDHRFGHQEQMEPEEDIFVKQDKAFLQAVSEKNPSYILSSYSDAIKTLKVSLSANESCRTGKSIVL